MEGLQIRITPDSPENHPEKSAANLP